MRIPSGDLAPARRRGGRSSYVRRRRRWPVVVAVLAVVGVAGGAYLLNRSDSMAPARLAQTSPTPSCPPTSAAPTTRVVPIKLPAPAAVVFALENGTGRGGLGKTVGDQLAARGLTVKTFGNAPALLAGDSIITFGPGAEPGAQLLAANVLGARLMAEPKAAAGALTVTLGSGYTRLRTPPEVSGYVATLALRTTVPAPARSCP